jgi:hypothetical protein
VGFILNMNFFNVQKIHFGNVFAHQGPKSRPTKSTLKQGSGYHLQLATSGIHLGQEGILWNTLSINQNCIYVSNAFITIVDSTAAFQ